LMDILNCDSMQEDSVGEFGGEFYSSSIAVRVCHDYCLAPMLRLDGTWAIKRIDAYVNASRAGTLPQYRRDIMQIERDTEEYLERPLFTCIFSAIMMVSLDRTHDMHYQYLARRQMAGVLLAVRIHQIERGHLPDTLERLVPDYLVKIPDDPMDEPGNRIRYVKDPKAPRLYCIGLNGRDDGGAYDDSDEDDPKDTLFFLSGRPETPR